MNLIRPDFFLHCVNIFTEFLTLKTNLFSICDCPLLLIFRLYVSSLEVWSRCILNTKFLNVLFSILNVTAC